MIEVACANIQSKTKINGLLSDPFILILRSLPRVSTIILLYITVDEVLAIDADTKIKGVQIGDNEIKQ